MAFAHLPISDIRFLYSDGRQIPINEEGGFRVRTIHSSRGYEIAKLFTERPFEISDSIQHHLKFIIEKNKYQPIPFHYNDTIKSIWLWFGAGVGCVFTVNPLNLNHECTLETIGKTHICTMSGSLKQGYKVHINKIKQE